MPGDLDIALALAAAAFGGAAVGVERQWSGHASGPSAHFAGVRTFTLLGLIGGMAGWLWHRGDQLPAGLLLGAGGALVVAAYVAASRRAIDATTEVAALVVIAAGFLSGRGAPALGAGVVAVTTLLLVEKSGLHRLVHRIDDTELRAAARFAVMAVVILPLLPAGPFGPWGGVRPRALWILVLLFSGLTFAGYLARRLIGGRHGYAVLGALGGLVSSTAVTLSFARRSRVAPEQARALASGIVAAATVMLARLLVAATVLDPRLGGASLRYAGPALLVGLLIVPLTALGLGPQRRGRLRRPRNPLDLLQALQMAALFQAVLVLMHAIEGVWGEIGVVASGAVLGATDVDALAVAMGTRVRAGADAALAARALAMGALANTVVKLAMTVGLGAPVLRRYAGAGLLALALTLAGSLALAPSTSVAAEESPHG